MMDGDALRCFLSEPGLKLATRGSLVAFHDGMEDEEVGKSEDEGNMEGQPAEADANNARLDGCHRAEVLRLDDREKEKDEGTARTGRRVDILQRIDDGIGPDGLQLTSRTLRSLHGLEDCPRRCNGH